MKKYLLSLVIITLVMLGGLVSAKSANAADLHGYVGLSWGADVAHENIDWVSFNCSDLGGSVCANAGNYKVSVNPSTGIISGYAWSSNFGWIKFGNGLSGMPVDSHVTSGSARIDTATGDYKGFFRACSGTVNGDCTGGDNTGGWDGWGSFSGTAQNNAPYGVHMDLATGASTGYAWGGLAIGWMGFNLTCPECAGVVEPPQNGSLDLGIGGDVAGATNSAYTVTQGTPFAIKWTSTNLTGYSCTQTSTLPAGGSGNSYWSGWGGLNSSNFLNSSNLYPISTNTGTAIGAHTFSVNCTKASQPNVSDSVTLVVQAPPVDPGALDLRVGPGSNPASATLHILQVTEGDPFILKWTNSGDASYNCVATHRTPQAGPITAWTNWSPSVIPESNLNTSHDTGSTLTTISNAGQTGIHRFTITCTDAVLQPLTSFIDLYVVSSDIIEI